MHIFISAVSSQLATPTFILLLLMPNPAGKTVISSASATNPAMSSLKLITNEAGIRHFDAGGKCICCRFDYRKFSLENDSFERVYDGVVWLFEEELGEFNQLKDS